MIKKPSFFSKLTGSADSEYDGYYSDEQSAKPAGFDEKAARHLPFNKGDDNDSHQEDPGGELAVDVYQTNDAIVVKALIAGVQPSTIDIALTREMLTISGSRTDDKEVEEDGYYQR